MIPAINFAQYRLKSGRKEAESPYLAATLVHRIGYATELPEKRVATPFLQYLRLNPEKS